MATSSAFNAICEIFCKDLEGGAAELENFLLSLGVKLNYFDYGISKLEFLRIVDDAFDGDRGRNFLGKKENLLNEIKH